MSGPFTEAFKTTGDTTLNLYGFRPDVPGDEAGFAAIVFFFSGGWRGFDHTKHYRQSAYLASRGMVCLNAEVRVEPIHGTPRETCVIDARSAIRYVRANAESLDVDPNRIAASGGSAAGCVSACCGIVPGYEEEEEDLSVSSKPDALVLFNPGLDRLNDRGVEMFGSLEKARTLSPTHHVKSGNPPAVVLHGKEDELLPVEEMLQFQKTMQEAGNRCDVHLYDGAAHGFYNRDPWFSETLKETDRFLTSMGYLEGEEEVDSFTFDDSLVESA